MNIIPRSATPTDPKWEFEFFGLARGLVMAGAKAKLIAHLTQLSQRRIRSLYRVLKGTHAPAGPVLQANARFFAMPSASTSSSWSIQCAIFLACYERVGAMAELPLNRGWQLLSSFNAYTRITEDLHRAIALTRLDINQAYGLLTHCRFLEDPKAELQRRACPNCLMNYLIVTTVALRAQPCPVCAMNSNSLRLVKLRGEPRRSRPRDLA